METPAQHIQARSCNLSLGEDTVLPMCVAHCDYRGRERAQYESGNN